MKPLLEEIKYMLKNLMLNMGLTNFEQLFVYNEGSLKDGVQNISEADSEPRLTSKMKYFAKKLHLRYSTGF